MNTEDTAGTAKLVVDSAKIDLLDAKLSEEGCAHDARFDRHVENAFLDDGTRNALIWMNLLAVGVKMALGAVLITLVEDAGNS